MLGTRERGTRTRLVVGIAAAAVLVAGGATLFLQNRAEPSSSRTYAVPGVSMEPTYEAGSTIRAEDVDGADVERGDVILHEIPGAGGDEAPAMKRVVALGGDEVAPGPGGTVLVNGEPLDEPYLAPGTTTENLTTQQVPEGHLFVLGDNRMNSSDSRMFGPVPEAGVVAVVVD